MADYQIPGDLHYTAEDEWVRRDGSRAIVGITDYAQQQLGDIVFLELPELFLARASWYYYLLATSSTRTPHHTKLDYPPAASILYILTLISLL